MAAAGSVIALTAGDPCGVGPEVILKALSGSTISRHRRMLVIGDHAVFEQTARRLHRRLPAWDVARPGAKRFTASLTFLDCGHQRRFIPGRSSAQSGRASLSYLDRAVDLWRAGRLQALVTAPVTKWAIARSAAPGFIGQTEYLARAMGVREVAMMFVADRLRVALLTRHLPLAQVPRAITPGLLRSTGQLVEAALRTQFRIRRPRLALCGVNPHAGEDGYIGAEEQRVMHPALQALRRKGIVCDGPFAADGFFACLRLPACLWQAQAGRQAQPLGYDAVICSYHDQGLIPFKMAARDQGCQLSVGLPIVRTSPDHGSALDIAGRNLAHPGSMRYAMNLAVQLLQQQGKGKRQK